MSSESDCLASKQNHFGCRLNFRRRRREVLMAFVWAGSSFLKVKTFGTLEEVVQIRHNASERPSPISGKVGHSLL